MKIIIFGTGEFAIKLFNETEHNTVAFTDNDYLKERDTFCGLTVAVPEKISQFDFDAVVIALPMESDIDKCIVYETISQLRLIGITKDILIYNGSDVIPVCQMEELLNGFIKDKAVLYEKINPKSIAVTHRTYVEERCSKRRLYLYGTGYVAISLTKYLATLDINVCKYISDKCTIDNLNGKEVISTFDLVYEDTNKIFIITASHDESYAETRKKLIGLGLKEDYDFTYYSEIPGTNEPFYYDATLSFSRVRDKVEGFEVFGDTENPNALKIVALGGSTTEGQLFYIKGWVPFFVDFLQGYGVSAKVYCGGISGYTSTQELLKFERDVLTLKPNIVISYSGVNDLYMYPYSKDDLRYQRPFITKFQVQFINQVLNKLTSMQYGLPTPDIPDWEKGGRDTVFYGLVNDKSPGQFWIDNARMMHALATEFGIKFFSFFQPFRFNGYYKSSQVQEILHSRRDPSCNPPEAGMGLYGRDEELKQVRKLIPKYQYITDLTELFLDAHDLYYDSVHVYEEGNKIIAQKIFDVLLSKYNVF